MSKRERNIIIACASVVFVGMMYLIWVFALSGNQTSSTTLQVVQPPATAQIIADQANCTSFSDKGSSVAGGVIDSGTCTINGVKYAVDTFASQSARDAWLVMAQKYGVVPAAETATSVVYKSVNTTA